MGGAHPAEHSRETRGEPSRREAGELDESWVEGSSLRREWVEEGLDRVAPAVEQRGVVEGAERWCAASGQVLEQSRESGRGPAPGPMARAPRRRRSLGLRWGRVGSGEVGERRQATWPRNARNSSSTWPAWMRSPEARRAARTRRLLRYVPFVDSRSTTK